MKSSVPKVPAKMPKKPNDNAMASYYGGRAEYRVRKTKRPVVYTDFTSQYPTVNALLGNWQVLKSSSIHFETCTAKVRSMLPTLTLDRTFERSFWKELSFFALVKPEEDILPVRTVYDGRTQNIGLNYLSSSEPIWYAGPDIVASRLLRGKRPKILNAIRMLPHGQQPKLESTNLGGMIAIKPYENNFFVRVIEQKS